MPVLKQAGDSAVLVYVHLFGRRHFGQAGQGHDVAGEGDQEPGAGGHLNIAYRDGEAPGRAQQGGVIREGVLSLGHADGQGAKAQLSELRRLLLGGGGEHHAVAVIDLRYDSGQLVLNGGVQLVGEGEVVGRIAEADDLLGQGLEIV